MSINSSLLLKNIKVMTDERKKSCRTESKVIREKSQKSGEGGKEKRERRRSEPPKDYKGKWRRAGERTAATFETKETRRGREVCQQL